MSAERAADPMPELLAGARLAVLEELEDRLAEPLGLGECQPLLPQPRFLAPARTRCSQRLERRDLRGGMKMQSPPQRVRLHEVAALPEQLANELTAHPRDT